MRTLVLLLHAGEAGDPARLAAAADAELVRLREHIPGVVRWQRAGRLSAPEHPTTPWCTDEPDYRRVLRDGLSNGVHVGGVDVVIDLSVDGGNGDGPSNGDAAIVAAVDGVAARLGDAVDPSRSIAVLGDDHVLLDGHGPVQLYYCMGRLASVTHDEFSRFWVEQHSQIGKVTPGLAGYHQLHADPAATHAVTEAAGFGGPEVDGVALEWFPDVAGFLMAVGSPPSFAQKAKSSETQFNDLSQAIATVTQVLAAAAPHGAPR